jgi:hypothetical protein
MEENPYEDYTAVELCQRWNWLETLKINSRIEFEMDSIEEALLQFYDVEAWNEKGEVIQYRPR